MREKGRHSVTLGGRNVAQRPRTVLGVDVATWSPVLISLQKLPLDGLIGVTTITTAY